MKLLNTRWFFFGACTLLSVSSCTSIMNDFSSTDFSSFSINGTYSGKLLITSVGSTVATDQTRFQITLSQQNGAISGTAQSLGDIVQNGIGVIDDAFIGHISSYTNYFAHINGYVYPKAKTLDQAKQDGSAIACDIVVNTLTNLSEGNLFPPVDSTIYVEVVLNRQ